MPGIAAAAETDRVWRQKLMKKFTPAIRISADADDDDVDRKKKEAKAAVVKGRRTNYSLS